MRNTFIILSFAISLVACSDDGGGSAAPRTPVGRANTWRDHCTEKCANKPRLTCETEPDSYACYAICGPELPGFDACVPEGNRLAICLETLAADELECGPLGAIPRDGFCEAQQHDVNACHERVREGDQ